MSALLRKKRHRRKLHRRSYERRARRQRKRGGTGAWGRRTARSAVHFGSIYFKG